MAVFFMGSIIMKRKRKFKVLLEKNFFLMGLAVGVKYQDPGPFEGRAPGADGKEKKMGRKSRFLTGSTLFDSFFVCNIV
jgi:hypothetical protein